MRAEAVYADDGVYLGAKFHYGEVPVAKPKKSKRTKKDPAARAAEHAAGFKHHLDAHRDALLCGAKSGDGTHRCTEIRGHKGDHAETDERPRVVSWGAEKPRLTLKSTPNEHASVFRELAGVDLRPGMILDGAGEPDIDFNTFTAVADAEEAKKRAETKCAAESSDVVEETERTTLRPSRQLYEVEMSIPMRVSVKVRAFGPSDAARVAIEHGAGYSKLFRATDGKGSARHDGGETEWVTVRRYFARTR